MSPLIWLCIAPLLGALAALVVPQRSGALVGLITAAVTLAAAVMLAFEVAETGVQQIALGGWGAPLGIILEADGLGTAFAVMTALVMTGVALAARHDLAARVAGPRTAFGFWPLMLLVWAAINAVFVSRDLFNLYVGLELLSLGAVALVALAGTRGALAAAMRYLVFALAGSLLYLAGVMVVYAAHGTLDMATLLVRSPAASDGMALGLMTAGLMAKTALFPFHVWLPPAHAAAPAPASAMLSALVPKASLVIMLRVWFDAMPDAAAPAALLLMAGLGAVAVIWGGVLALVQSKIKLVIAYSTVAQLGYLVIAFPLTGGESAVKPWSAGAWTGMVFIALSHGLAKSAMFLVAGIWYSAAGAETLRDLRGLARALPMSTLAFALAAVTLAGLPPSGGFTGKYLMMQAAFVADLWGFALVLLAGGLLAAAYLYRPLAMLFARDEAVLRAPVSRARQLVPLALAAAAIGLGVLSAVPFDFIKIGKPYAAAAGL
ncbi:MAG: complex I subunit 5 family protein [Erythrobacter sp.]